MILTDDPRQLDLAGNPPRRDGIAHERAKQPLRPVRPQQPCDVGLFGDSPAQIDLEDLIKQRG